MLRAPLPLDSHSARAIVPSTLFSISSLSGVYDRMGSGASTDGAAAFLMPRKLQSSAAPPGGVKLEKPPPYYPVAPEPGELDAISVVVRGKLYLSNWRAAEDQTRRRHLGITHIAAVGAEFFDEVEERGIVYWKKRINDDEAAEGEMAASLREGATFIEKAVVSGGRVLVHCAAGISRSATCVLAYLVLHGGHSLFDAFGVVLAERRPVCARGTSRETQGDRARAPTAHGALCTLPNESI